MSNDQALVQVNLKSGVGYDATLINVYAKTPAELEQLLTAVKEYAPLIAEASSVVKLAHGIEVKQGTVQTQVQGVPAEQAVQQVTQQTNGGWGAPPDTPPPSWSQPAQQAPTCQHGPMVHRSGNKNGRDWSGYFCPTPKGTPGQCDPKFGK